MNKKQLALLEKVFAAEVEDALPYQTKSKLAQEMCTSGFLEPLQVKMGLATVTGYALTHAGRIKYCESCRETGEPEDAIAPSGSVKTS